MPVKREVQIVLKNSEGGYLILQDKDEHRGLLTAVQQYDEDEDEAAQRRVEEAVGIPLIQVKGEVHQYQYTEDDITHRVTAVFAETQRKELDVQDETIDEAGWVEGQTLLSAVDSEDERDAVQAALEFESMEGETEEEHSLEPGGEPGPAPGEEPGAPGEPGPGEPGPPGDEPLY